MSAMRPWLPTVGAGVLLLLALFLGTHVHHTSPPLQPLPHAVHVRRADVADLGAELATPLYAPSRSPAPPSGAADVQQAPPPVLSGVVLGAGKAVALVRSAGGGGTLMLHVGDTVDGWTVTGIAARQIMVARAGSQQIVALIFGGKPTSPDGTARPVQDDGHPPPQAPGFDGLAAATGLGLPETSIPRGSPLTPPR